MSILNNRNTKTKCEICSNLTTKILEWRQWRRSDVFIVNFEHFSHIVLVFLLLNLSTLMPAGYLTLRWSNQPIFFSHILNLLDSNFYEAFFPRNNRCYDNWKIVYFLFSWQPLLGKKFFHQNNASYQSKKISIKIGSKQIKNPQEQLS